MRRGRYFSGNFDSSMIPAVNNEGCAVCQTFVSRMLSKLRVRRQSVADHRIFDFRDGVRAAVPCFVGEVGIGRNGVHAHAQFLQFFVMVCNVAQFSRAYEGEVSRIEEEYVQRPSVSFFSVTSMNSPF